MLGWKRYLNRLREGVADSNPKFKAHIDGFEARKVYGWVKHVDSDDPLRIDVFVNDVCISEGYLANEFRPDLADAGFGDGCFAYNLTLPDSLQLSGGDTKVRLRLAGGGPDIVARHFDLSKPIWDASIDGIGGGQLYGWVKLRDVEAPQAIDIYVGETRIVQGQVADRFRQDLLDHGVGNGCYGFSLRIPADLLTAGAAVSISLRSSGSDQEIKSKEFSNYTKAAYTYRIENSNVENISGWCVNKFSIGETFNLEVYINDAYYTTINTNKSRGDLKSKGISLGFGGFFLSNPMSYLERGSYQFHFKFPDGTISEKFTIESDQDRRKLPSFQSLESRRSVSIVVPIYNAVDDVEICIKRLLAHTASHVRILLIDDFSPDPAIKKLLQRYEGQVQISVFCNERNIGFTATVNRGLNESGDDDVVLLNSDARVTPGWLEGLRAAAYSGPKIATVTAMSDRAGAFSAPRIGNDNPLPENVSEAAFAKSFRRRSLGLYPRVPTGNGFCLYVSRAAIDELGGFDAEAFPRGYGEENDFCMRALRAGWRNIIDDRTYVFHERSASFGTAKSELLAAGRAIIDERYPEYKNAIGTFTSEEKIVLARFCGGQAKQDCINGVNQNPRILFVISTTTGGTPQTNRDLIAGLGNSVSSWILRCDSKLLELSEIANGEANVVRTHHLGDPVDAISHRSPEYDAVVSSWLFDFDFDLVHIRHIAWHSLSLPRLAKDLGIKVVVSFHDYYTLTPTIKLIDDMGEFLGQTYLPEGSMYREGLWPKNQLPVPTDAWLAHWRQRFQTAFEGCDAFVTTSESPRALLLEKTPGLPAEKFFVIPHGRDFTEFQRTRNAPRHGEPLRILVPGNINAAKGLKLIYALAEYDKARLLEFHILGNLQSMGRSIPSNIVTHGNYQRSEFGSKAALTRPHVGAVFSIWDETYCHTLTELWSIGLPAIVFDFPTVANRVRKTGAGWVMDFSDIPALYEEILRVSFDETELAKVDSALTAWQAGEGLGQTVGLMAAGYLDIYRKVLRGETIDAGARRSPRIAVVDLSAGGSNEAVSSRRIESYTRNTIEKDRIFVPMPAGTLLANIRTRAIDGAIIRWASIPRTMLNDLVQAFATAGLPYLLDIEEESIDASLRDLLAQGDSARSANRIRLIERAAVVTVDTPYLFEKVQTFTPNVTLQPDGLTEDVRPFGA